MNIKELSIMTTRIDANKRRLLQTLAALGQKPTIRVNATMDAATYEGVEKSVNDYQLITAANLFLDNTAYSEAGSAYVVKSLYTVPEGVNASDVTLKADIKSAGNEVLFDDTTERSSADPAWVEYTSHTLAAEADVKLSVDAKGDASTVAIGYSIDGGSVVSIQSYINNHTYQTFTTTIGIHPINTVIHFWYTSPTGAGNNVFTDNSKVINLRYAYAGYTKNSAVSGDVSLIGSEASASYVQKTLVISDIVSGDIIRFWLKSSAGTSYIDECIVFASASGGNIKTIAISSDADIIRYWEKVKMNLSKGTSTHATPLQLKIFGSADAYAAALNSSWVTIPESEYDELLLERKIIKTATSDTQTTWDFTSLTGADALINEIGCQYVLIVEQANDGSTYSVLEENIDYFVDISDRKSPRITLASGAGIVNATSTLRATMIVDILKIDDATKNTGVKVQINENRTSVGETSPSIQPLPVATTQYVSVDYIARY